MILNENEILRQRLRENDLDFSDEDVEEFLKTDYVGDIDFSKTDIEYLPLKGSIKNISGNVNLSSCENLTDLGRLTSVSGDLNLFRCYDLTDLGNLTSVGVYISGFKGDKSKYPHFTF